MKKLVLVLIGISFLSGIILYNKTRCTIEGTSCSIIVSAIQNNDTTLLSKLGISVIMKKHFLDGGSVAYTLSNGVTVFQKWNSMGADMGWGNTTISFPNGRKFVLKKKHNKSESDSIPTILHRLPPPDCVVNRMLCKNLTQELNRFFKDKHKLELYTQKSTDMELKGFQSLQRPQGRPLGAPTDYKPSSNLQENDYYIEKNCDEEDLCSYSIRPSDTKIIGVCAENRQQNGETYTYTLEDGRTLLFNWKPDDPEHGFLTVTETDGTQKKFDPQGNRVN